ncbi:hypothetical protein PIB30_025781 [Stylosanthes scabra]|uniref:Uncharacterized protein n=1 Tax=Stylosanthes scabra TaxID=79078 RepID=A0ABU6S9R0_9FABA|nr:hypothetical protein [Stylosanthes scabra]
MLAPLASSGGSAPGQHSANVAGSSRRAIQAEPEAQLVASPTFEIYNEAEVSDLVADLGDIVTEALQALCAPPVHDDDSDPVPNQQGGASSSGTHQYSPHLSNLNLDALRVLGNHRMSQAATLRALKGPTTKLNFRLDRHLWTRKLLSLL